MTTTFSPPRAPGIGPKKGTKYKIVTAEFGDGYVQRAKDGINNKTVSYDLFWNGLSVADADTIEDFFDAQGGYLAFLYTVPGDTERKYINGDVSRQDYGIYSNISVSITEVHDP